MKDVTQQYSKILIIEDDPIVALDLSLVLSEMGCSVIGIAKDHSNAVELMFHNPADILLCDINLQNNESGIDVVKTIRKTFDPVVIYLTALEDTHTVKKAIETDPYGYLLKPYRYSELFALVQLSLRQPKNAIPHRINESIEVGEGFLFNTQNNTLSKDTTIIPLTNKEQKLLFYLVSYPYQIIPFDKIEREVWPNKPISDSSRRTLFYRLHTKLSCSLITVLPGKGCYLEAFSPDIY